VIDDPDKAKRYRAFVAALEAAQCDLAAYLCYLLGNPSDVDDVVQETNMTLCREWERFDPERPFIAWAKTVAYYQAMTWLKTVSREKVVFDETVVDFLAVMDSREEEAGADETERRTYWLGEGLKTLPREHRSLVNFRYRRHYTLAQLSRRYKMSVASLSFLLIRIRKQLGDFIVKKMREENGYGL